MFYKVSLRTGLSTRRSLSSSSRSSVQASEEPEERETLALMAARGDSEETQDGETYIEKYTRGVLEVENILSLERLRQVRQHKLHNTLRREGRTLSYPPVSEI